jgi:hypothetical protein
MLGLDLSPISRSFLETKLPPKKQNRAGQGPAKRSSPQPSSLPSHARDKQTSPLLRSPGPKSLSQPNPYYAYFSFPP